jgi:hypothetical protein
MTDSLIVLEGHIDIGQCLVPDLRKQFPTRTIVLIESSLTNDSQMSMANRDCPRGLTCRLPTHALLQRREPRDCCMATHGGRLQ